MRRRSSVRPDQSRSRWAWSGRRKKEIMAWLLSVSTFFCTDNGFAGSLAGKPLNLNVKSVKFPRGRHGAKPKTGRTFAHAVCWNLRVWSGMEGACLSGAGQSLPLGETGRFLVLRSGRPMRAWPGRTARIWPGSGRVAVSLTEQATGPALRKWGFSGQMPAAAIPCVSDRHRRRRPSRGFVSRRRRRVERGPEGDAL